MLNTFYKPGEIIGDSYQIIKTLGQGGMGITYSAKNLQTDQLVALKVLSLQRANDWKVIELFEREAKVLKNLYYPGIPAYIDYFQIDTETDKTFVIVQQLAPGRSLFDLIESGWKPSLKQVQAIAAKVLEILAYLQQLTPPVIHRDIKPQNIICHQDGSIFLVDFGAVQDTYHQTVTGGSTIVGTFGYMAPEQFRGQAVLSTDLYGLGTTLLYLLTRESPADLPQKKLKIDFQSTLNLPNNFADWLERMIEPISDMRFISATVALSVLHGNKPLPPQPEIIQRPNNTKIKLNQKGGILIIDIPTTLLSSNLSLFLGLAPLFIIVICFGIFYAWFFEIAVSQFPPNYHLFIFSLYASIFCMVSAIPIWKQSSKSVFFSSAFNKSIKITSKLVVIKNEKLGWFGYPGVILDESFPVTCTLKEQKILVINQRISLVVNYCLLKKGKTKLKFGTFLTSAEKAWLVHEINAFIENYQQD